MAENKQQHFVAKSYLKNFCVQNTESVYRFDLATIESKQRNVNRIFREPYFYADGSVAPIFEPALSALEDKHARTIQQILETQTLTITSLKDLMYLHLLVLITKTRTKASKEEIENMARWAMVKKLPYLAESEVAKEALEKFIKQKKLHHRLLQFSLKHSYVLSNLAPTLLLNTTNPFMPFITSDSPVVFHNLLKGGLLGYQNKGLIVVLPLSEDIALCLFDSYRYKPRNVTNNNIVVSSAEDINALNRLHIINAAGFLIFSKQQYHDYVLLLQTDLLWNPLNKPTSLKLSFFEIYNEDSFRGDRLFEPRNQEIAASLNKAIKEIRKGSF